MNSVLGTYTEALALTSLLSKYSTSCYCSITLHQVLHKLLLLHNTPPNTIQAATALYHSTKYYTSFYCSITLHQVLHKLLLLSTTPPSTPQAATALYHSTKYSTSCYCSIPLHQVLHKLLLLYTTPPSTTQAATALYHSTKYYTSCYCSIPLHQVLHKLLLLYTTPPSTIQAATALYHSSKYYTSCYCSIPLHECHVFTVFCVSRMGSFTSAPKILNDDLQDSDLDLPETLSREQLLQRCHKELEGVPALVSRRFRSLDEEQLLSQTELAEGCAEPSSGSQNIRILQWNLLSQALGQTNDNFVCCPDEALEWRTRRFHIVEELVGYNPDIICLQEVDHFNFLKKVLGSLGYSGMFFPKPDSPCLYIKGNNGSDGCAIFYRKDKLELLKMETRILEVWRVQSNQVAILLLLKLRGTGREICVATTHLKARNGALLSTLRNEQGKDFLEFVQAHAGPRPVLLCGDFNAEPTEPVYHTILSHEFLRLASAYASLSVEGEEPPYTTWKVREEGEVCHTIDYVFYSRDSFSVDSLLEFPSGEDIGEGRVPSWNYPSDHFSLVCDLRFIPFVS
uniref:Nocturnin n=1 Tax=Timema californicum TaxID=61474 RepID=A0A7R9JAG9_TIMCA|nr:unnamed protein product [Timema californicum]